MCAPLRGSSQQERVRVRSLVTNPLSLPKRPVTKKTLNHCLCRIHQSLKELRTRLHVGGNFDNDCSASSTKPSHSSVRRPVIQLCYRESSSCSGCMYANQLCRCMRLLTSICTADAKRSAPSDNFNCRPPTTAPLFSIAFGKENAGLLPACLSHAQAAQAISAVHRESVDTARSNAEEKSRGGPASTCECFCCWKELGPAGT